MCQWSLPECSHLHTCWLYCIHLYMSNGLLGNQLQHRYKWPASCPFSRWTSEDSARTETCCQRNICSQCYLTVMPFSTLNLSQKNCPGRHKVSPTTTSFLSYACTRLVTSLAVLAYSTCYLLLLPADPDTCGTSSPCVNGDCENLGPGSFVCFCSLGWSGTLCDQCKI